MRNAFALVLCLLLIPQLSEAEDSPPNILLIIADQHTGSIMTQRGYAHITTPGIDKIADSGVTFARGYTTYPVCKAYRKSVMTGMMPSNAQRCRIRDGLSRQMARWRNSHKRG
jgi:arylsulfatase A-like enzyme